VLEQRYRNLEYSVLDGGSSDGTIEILQRYGPQLSFWRSEKDGGQAAAINEGFQRASGDILCWLNSDDLHVPATLTAVARLLGSNLDAPVILYGGCEMFDAQRHWRAIRPAIPFRRELLERVDFLDQPSVFWTRRAWEVVGPLDATLCYGFDWEWFLRASKVCRFVATGDLLSRYRFHEAQKTGIGGEKRWIELLEIVRRHSPPGVVRHYEFLAQNGFARWWLNKRMRIFQRLSRWSPKVAGTLADLLSPPFWSLPAAIHKEVLWQISGIR
jgi:glycosyltransferase involved in cell wall biosynthesis